jgi:hypothetical protein
MRGHFGLGEAERIERLEVRWPSGRKQAWSGLEVDRYWVLEESCNGTLKGGARTAPGSGADTATTDLSGRCASSHQP